MYKKSVFYCSLCKLLYFLAVYPPYGHGGIDLANYFPSERYFNSVVYIHKKFLKPKEKREKDKDKVIDKEKKQKKVKKTKADKCQQFASDVIRAEIPIYQDSGARIGVKVDTNNSVLEQTMQFAKNIVPIVIPPTKEQYPVYYAIKATKKSKKQTKPENYEGTQDITYKKEKSRKVETYSSERVGKESFSVKETISYSSRSDTLNEIHLDPSLCCSFSDAFEQKHQRKGKKEKRDSQKFAVSKSFEALATKYCNSGDTKIKVHLMNDTDKNLLTDNIKMPILNAIKDCIKDINNREIDEVMSTVHKVVKCNTQQLDNIMEKVTCVERKIDKYFIKEKQSVNPKLPTATLPDARLEKLHKEIKQQKVSALERLENDILEVNVNSEAEEEFLQSIDLTARRKVKSNSAVMQISDKATDCVERKEENKSEMGCGETAIDTVGMGARPNRLPARYCWTGVARKT